MKVAVSIWSLHKEWFAGKLTNLDFLRYSTGLCIDGVELLDSFWHNQVGEIREIKSLLASNNLEIACYALTNDFVNLSAKQRSLALDQVKQGVDVGCELGVTTFRIFGGDLIPDVSSEQALDWIITGLASAAEYAQANDVSLYLENHGLLVGHSKQVDNVLTMVNNPHLGSTFDMGNFLLAKDNPQEALTRLSNFIGHVHAKDLRTAESDELDESFAGIDNQKFVGTVLGLGEVNVEAVVQSLRSLDYEGYISIEYEGLEEPRFGTEASVKNLRQYL